MDFKRMGIAWFDNISEKFDTLSADMDANCQESLKLVGHQLVAVGTHVKEFYSEIENQMEKEVLEFLDSQTPTAAVESQEPGDVSPFPEEISVESAKKELHDDSSVKQNHAIGVDEKSNADYGDAEISSLISLKIVESNSSIEEDTSSKLVDVRNEVTSTASAGRSDVSSTEEVSDHVVEDVSATTVTEKVVHIDELPVNKLDLDESFILVGSNDFSESDWVFV